MFVYRTPEVVNKFHDIMSNNILKERETNKNLISTPTLHVEESFHFHDLFGDSIRGGGRWRILSYALTIL